MQRKKHGLAQKLKYSFDNLMSKGGFSVFIFLMVLFLLAIVFIGAIRFVANVVAPQENMTNIFDQWWLSFLQVADSGGIESDNESNVLNRIVGIIALFLGLVLFSSLVAFITSQFDGMLTRMRKGKSNVIERNHTLILGFGDRVLEIIRELIIANESERKPAVVVLSETEKDEMDDFFRERIPEPKTTRIITRSGSTSSIALLKRVGAEAARSVIILNDATEDATDEDKAKADARVLKTIMAVLSCTGEERLPPIVAELHLKNNQNLARNISDRVSIIDEYSILAKLMVQTSRVSGLAQVYDHLVGFEGNEFYFYNAPEGWGKKTFEEVCLHFPTCCVLGIRLKKGEILINPDKKKVLNDDDEVIVLAEDDSAIRFSKQKVKINPPAAVPTVKIPKIVEKQLIVGWSQKAGTIIDEYSNYLIEDSAIDLIVPDPADEIKKEFSAIQTRHPKIRMRLIKGAIENPEVVNKLAPDQYDNVLILASGSGDAEIKDAETIARLLEFRSYFKALGKQDLKTQLITEVADSDNIEIIQNAGVKDFLISNRFVSKIYAQVSEEPDVLKIYEDLFSEEGSEVYIKPVSLYVASIPAKISFGDLCAAALLRNEVCFGIRIMDEEKDAEKAYGIYINPGKNDMFSLKQTDMLITFAEDET